MNTQRSYAPDVNNLYPRGVPILAEIASHYKVPKDTHTIDYGKYRRYSYNASESNFPAST